VVQNGEVSYVAVDGVKSVVAESPPHATPSYTAVYDVWGKIKAETGTRRSPFAYREREDSEAGLLYSNGRYYDTTLARFTQEDPVTNYPPQQIYANVDEDWGPWVLSSNPFFNDPQSKVKPDDYNGTICDGHGNVIPTLNTADVLRPDAQRCGIYGCAVDHEKGHIDAINGRAPGICNGQPFGIKVGFASEAERAREERAAYQREILCLYRLADLDPKDCSGCGRILLETAQGLYGKMRSFK
jgi:RHS repeat-associated protein